MPAHEFGQVGAWSAGVIASEATPNSGDSVGVGSPVADSMPSYVARAANTWTAVGISEATTQLTMDLSMEMSGLAGAIMNAPMRWGMGRLLQANLEELKHYIETGHQHPRKARASGERT